MEKKEKWQSHLFFLISECFLFYFLPNWLLTCIACQDKRLSRVGLQTVEGSVGREWGRVNHPARDLVGILVAKPRKNSFLLCPWVTPPHPHYSSSEERDGLTTTNGPFFLLSSRWADIMFCTSCSVPFFHSTPQPQFNQDLPITSYFRCAGYSQYAFEKPPSRVKKHLHGYFNMVRF